MFDLVLPILRSLVSAFRSHSDLWVENLALRHQLTVLNRRTRKPKLRYADRLLWVGLLRCWPRWQHALLLFQPQTVIAWHRLGFRLFWRWKSRAREGRPAIDCQLIALIRRMWQTNPTWGSPRIQAELAKLGIQISDSTIRKYRPKQRRSASSQTWRTFLHNHAKELVAIDFFTVPTATFRVLYVFLVLAHERRKVLHFHITEAPSAAWTAQQMVEAFPFTTPPRYLLRDRDGIYGADFVWRGFRAPSRGLGLGTKAHCPSIALAESDGRTTHWLDPPRKFRPRDYLQWASPAPDSLQLLSLLSSRSDPQIPRPRLSDLTPSGTARSGQDYRTAAPGRTASSLHSASRLNLLSLHGRARVFSRSPTVSRMLFGLFARRKASRLSGRGPLFLTPMALESRKVDPIAPR